MRRLAVLLLSLAVLPAAAEARRRPVTLRMPAFDVPPFSNREVCTFVPLPAKSFDVGAVVITNLGGNAEFATHHMIIYQYTGPLDPLAGTERQVVDDKACLRFGTGDPRNLTIVATSQSIRGRQPMPEKTFLPLQVGTLNGRPTVGLVFNSHWINGSDRTQRARVKVKLVPARKAVKQLKPIFEVFANAFIRVPPGGTGEADGTWQPGGIDLGGFLGGAAPPQGPACVTMLIAHTHRRGTLFTASFDDGSGAPPVEVYRNTDYADPRPRDLSEQPLLVKPGQKIAYHCEYDNATDPKLGCEEEAGVPPGRSIVDGIVGGNGFASTGAAKGCRIAGASPTECPATDPDLPGRTFTGNCVPANVVFGFTSEDEMCILPGYYYDADPDAAPGRECDIS